MSTQGAARHVAGWLNDLAVMTAGSTPLADGKAKVAALSGALANGYPIAAFCPKSLLDIARQCKFFPAYSELCEHLDEWWKIHKPPQPELPPPTDTWSERVARERHEATESWRTITAVEVRAKIADVQSLPASSWAVACGVMLAGCLRKHAPHHLGLLPPAWLDDRDTAPTTAAARVKPHYLKPEVLQAEKERLRREKQPA